MKVTKQQPEFTPITLVLETQEELDYIFYSLKTNISVPELIKRIEGKDVSTRVGGEMHYELSKALHL